MQNIKKSKLSNFKLVLIIVLALGCVTWWINRVLFSESTRNDFNVVDSSSMFSDDQLSGQDLSVFDESVSVELPSVPDSLSGGINFESNNIDQNSGNPDSIENRYEIDLSEDVSIHQIEDIHYDDQAFSYVSLADDKSTSVVLNSVELNASTSVTKTVMGFAPYWSLSTWSSAYQYDKLSHIAYFGLNADANGNWITGDSGWNGWNSATMSTIINNAHANGVKVVLVVKNFDAAGIYSIVTNTNGAKTTLINNIVTEIRNKGVDGVNIDFEYISSGSGTGCGGYPCTADRVRPYIPTFMQDLSTRIHTEFPGSHVSLDVLGGSATWYSAYDITALGQTSIDGIMVMAYDYYRVNSSMAAPSAPLYGSQYYLTVSESIDDFIAQAPANKIIMGVPYYGLEFPTTGSAYNSSTSRNGAISYYSGVVDPSEDAYHNSNTIKWNDTDKVRWYVYRWPDVNTSEWWQGYYDDPDSLGAKYDFVKNKNLQGVGIWALGYDYGYNELWNTLRDKFSKEPFIVMFKDGVSKSTQQQIHNALGTEVVLETIYDNIVVVRPLNRISIDVMNDYKNRTEVRSVSFEADRYLYLETANEQ
ncbi:glycoside hydrolase family 18 protein [Candidatus Dojkabacteria bacterium]|nr:glycoside hydrolase family 18 protein [Candidatus Dojkabacteria bacterium]